MNGHLDNGIDANTFRAAMRRLPAQVAVITSQHQGVRNALTATALTSVSAEPPQLLVCVHHLARPAQLIRDAGVFGVTLLTQVHKPVAQQCALSKLDAEARFAVGEWFSGSATGVPLLHGASVNFECRLQSAAQHGTHWVFVGLVLSITGSNNAPLLYHDGAYCELGSHSGTFASEWDSARLGF
ncbi:MAG: flavin reductase family protein [Paludibacter sp.]